MCYGYNFGFLMSLNETLTFLSLSNPVLQYIIGTGLPINVVYTSMN